MNALGKEASMDMNMILELLNVHVNLDGFKPNVTESVVAIKRVVQMMLAIKQTVNAVADLDGQATNVKVS